MTIKPIPKPEERENAERIRAFITGGLIIAVVCVLFFGGIYLVVKAVFNSKNNACIQNPFSYAVTELEDKWGYDFYAIGKFDAEYSPLISINRTGAYKNENLLG